MSSNVVPATERYVPTRSVDVLSGRFDDERTGPAWLQSSIIAKNPNGLSARDLTMDVGDFEVRLQDLATVMTHDDGSQAIQVVEGHKLLVRDPIGSERRPVVYDIVSDQYEIIQPWDFAGIWDDLVQMPVESVGVFKGGRAQFISSIAQTFAIAGESMTGHLLAINGLDGRTSINVRLIYHRVTCWNQLSYGGGVREVHRSGVRDKLTEYISQVIADEVTGITAFAGQGELLAATGYTPDDLNEVLDHVYRPPRRPRKSSVSEVYEKALEEYAYRGQLIQNQRQGVLSLLDGRGTDLDTPATKETLWGVYNAVVENEDYRRGGSNANHPYTVTVEGDRHLRKVRAWEGVTGLAMSKN